MLIYLSLLFKYSLFYLFFFLIGRSFTSLLIKLFSKESGFQNYILNIKSTILYPIIGLIFTGNLLIFLNYFFPLRSNIIFIILSLFLLINVNNKLSIKDIKKYLDLKFLFYYVFIPGVLLASSYSISFHYDAGFYHLSHQNWLRESNMIFGMVNIFWAYGMSSIYEYLSAILWFDSTFILLHFLNLIFVHFLILFIWDNSLFGKFKELKFIAYMLIIVSLLDNFGLQGGRNGYIYLDGVTKQDVTVGILFCFVSFTTIKLINEKNLKDLDIVILSLMSLFIIQIKISGIFILYVYFIFILNIIIRNKLKFSNLLKLHIPLFAFLSSWLLKNFFTTGCLIFPFTPTCRNNFSWYQKSNTRYAEITTSSSSLGFIDYMHDQTRNITDWFKDIIEYEFYFSIFVNFLITLFILLLIRKLLFVKTSPNKNILYIQISFVLINSAYLAFFGPIPRYSIGITLTIFSFLGFFIEKEKIKINKLIIYSLLIFTTGLTVRSDSYFNMLSGKELALFDPRINAEYIDLENGWVIPRDTDQCWINIECLSYNPDLLGYKLSIEKINNFFNVAKKIDI